MEISPNGGSDTKKLYIKLIIITELVYYFLLLESCVICHKSVAKLVVCSVLGLVRSTFPGLPVQNSKSANDFLSLKCRLKSVRFVVSNVIMVGPPGAGKTLLARAMTGILPKMSIEEALDVTRIYSVADALPPEMMVRTRPFRAPHHTISHAGLVGGGNWPHPGEISLAHRGVLFLDELPEFGTRVLEVMRQPIEDKVVTISRAHGSLTFPANFMLVATINPCLCRDRRITCGTLRRIG